MELLYQSKKKTRPNRAERKSRRAAQPGEIEDVIKSSVWTGVASEGRSQVKKNVRGSVKAKDKIEIKKRSKSNGGNRIGQRRSSTSGKKTREPSHGETLLGWAVLKPGERDPGGSAIVEGGLPGEG